MIKTKIALISLLTLLSISNCKENKIINKNFNYIIIFSDATAYFFKIKNDPFIKEDILFINEKDIEMIKDKLENVKKILLTHKSNNKILNNKRRKNLFSLPDIKFSLKKAIDFIFSNSLTKFKSSLIMRDNTLNKEDLEYLEKRAKRQNINITIIDNKNIEYLKNFITPKIEKIILFSMKNNHIYLKRLSRSMFFKKIEFILIGDTKKNLKEINSKYIIGINELDLIDIIKKIDKNFYYELNIYKR
ncbi:hypothetical protein F0310_00905 [Borrelia sp. A-FGy1]|uniref:hypothetical protein n=1 Tax=Borrelia sp. A-FGy1 TaxID=2608247 RepID=UPI0015F39239|nr:hypothetical protein [Borrelia sp. A-FGy1]QMU98994.1 hypothetical protein F0310_00905 [Borrelia sp. A-FGy1]